MQSYQVLFIFFFIQVLKFNDFSNVSTTVWVHSNERLGEKARWEVHKNAVFEQILVAALNKMAVERPLSSHLTNQHSKKSCWVLLANNGELISHILQHMNKLVLATQTRRTVISSLQNVDLSVSASELKRKKKQHSDEVFLNRFFHEFFIRVCL